MELVQARSVRGVVKNDRSAVHEAAGGDRAILRVFDGGARRARAHSILLAFLWAGRGRGILLLRGGNGNGHNDQRGRCEDGRKRFEEARETPGDFGGWRHARRISLSHERGERGTDAAEQNGARLRWPSRLQLPWCDDSGCIARPENQERLARLRRIWKRV